MVSEMNVYRALDGLSMQEIAGSNRISKMCQKHGKMESHLKLAN